LPRLQSLANEYAERGLVAWAVNFGDKPETVRAYFEKERISMPPLLQIENKVSKAFGVQAYPTTYVLGPDGKVAWRAVGFDETSLRSALEKVAPPK
jgi:AhpC/TSA family protein